MKGLSSRKEKNGKYATEDNMWRSAKFVTYLKYFPNGKYATEDNVWRLGGVHLYLEYFYPHGQFLLKAEQKLIGIITNADSFEIDKSLAQYFKYFANGKHKTQVEEALWGRITSEDFKLRIQKECKRYLKYFPKGKHAAEAKRKLKD